MTELWKFAWQLRSFHDLTIWNLTIWNKWKYCILDKRQFDKGQTETGQIEKGQIEKGQIEKGHFWKGIFELALPKGHFDEGHIWKGISERAFWWRALKGRSFWGKGISEGRKGKGHEGHCAWTRIFPLFNGISRYFKANFKILLRCYFFARTFFLRFFPTMFTSIPMQNSLTIKRNVTDMTDV